MAIPPALGSPAIPTPRPDDWRTLQTSIQNARQRIEQLERQLGITNSTLQQTNNAASSDLSSILFQLNNLTLRVTALENAANTDIGYFIAGESIVAGQGIVPISSTAVGVADSNDPTRIFSLIGIAVGAATTGGTVPVQRRGVYAPPGASGWTVGRAVYLDGASLTQTPDDDATSLPVGVAVSSNQVFITPDFPALMDPSYSGFTDTYRDYLPVTYKALRNATSAGGDNVIYDNRGHAMLTQDGHAMLV